MILLVVSILFSMTTVRGFITSSNSGLLVLFNRFNRACPLYVLTRTHGHQYSRFLNPVDKSTTDVGIIETWFIEEIGVTDEVARKYTNTLFDQNISSADKLLERLIVNPNYLRSLDGFDSVHASSVIRYFLGVAQSAG
jgi:uncharacterized membrane protein